MMQHHSFVPGTQLGVCLTCGKGREDEVHSPRPTKTPEQTLHTIRAILNTGRLDRHLDQLAEMIHARRNYTLSLEAAQLSVGDTVALRNIKPKYMTGMRGTILNRVGTKFEIELDNMPPRGRYGRRIIVPATTLRLV